MRCPRCGNENPESNRFCGMCGATLLQAPAVALPAVPLTATVNPSARDGAVGAENPVATRTEPSAEPARPESAGVPLISGPSFLGLNDPGPAPQRRGSLSIDPSAAPRSRNLDYLLEDDDEPKRGGAGKFFLIVLALLLAVGFGYLRWKNQGLPWLRSLAARSSASAPNSPASDSGSAASGSTAPGLAAPGSTTPGSTTPGSTNPATTPTEPTDAPNATDGATPASAPANGATTPSTAPASATPNATPVPAQAAPNQGNPNQATSNQATPAQTTPGQTTPAPTGSGRAAPGPTSPAESGPAQTNTGTASAPAHAAASSPTPAPKGSAVATGDDTAAASPDTAVPAEAAPKPRPAAPRVDPVTEAHRYLYGQDVPQNCDRGLRLLKPLADAANTKAMTEMGALYSAGLCTPRDLPTAYRWFAMALRKDPNNQSLAADLSKLWGEMTQPERQLAIRLSQ